MSRFKSHTEDEEEGHRPDALDDDEAAEAAISATVSLGLGLDHP